MLVNQYDQRVWLEKLRVRTQAPTQADPQEVSALGRLMAGLPEPESEQAQAVFEDEELSKDIQRVLGSLPHEQSKQMKDALKQDHWRAGVLERAVHLLQSHLNPTRRADEPEDEPATAD
jgi:uncharacterized protein YcbX